MATSSSAEPVEEDWVLPSEIEVLESIYLDELQVVKGNGRSSPWEVYITLHPATAEDQDSQYVCFTLVLQVPAQYPSEVPQISIRNPRGLSDEQIHKISQALSQVATAGLGTAMLYELIEKGKEILTDNNIPHGQCVICLYGFQESEAFTKTSCYHYFHCHCLARYIQHMEQELQAQGQEEERQHAAARQKAVSVQCPVCREPLVYDLASLKAAPEPQQPMEPYQPNAESLRQQEELRRLYKRQQERGGIIDLEAERNRYFISLQQVRKGFSTPSQMTPTFLPAPLCRGPRPPAPLEPESAVDASRGSQSPIALATELSTSSTAHPPQSLLPVASQYTCERIPGTGPNQQRLGESQKAILGRPRASRGPWRQPERRHLKGGEYSAPRGTNDTQEVLPAEKPPKEPMDPKPEPHHQGVEGPPLHRTGDCARWGRPKSRTPGSSYPRLRRGRGAYPPGTRREPLSLESEDGS